MKTTNINLGVKEIHPKKVRWLSASKDKILLARNKIFNNSLLFIAAIAFGTGVNAQTYCVPEGTNSARGIEDFSTTNGVQNITNNGSGFSSNGYGDFTAQIVSQSIGSSIDFTATTISSTTAGFRVWVDWDQDGVFDATNEVVYQSSGYGGTHAGSFSVPTSAIVGNTTIRVVSHWLSTTGDVSPCATSFTYGEFEDYTIDVLPAPSCLSPSNLAAASLSATSAGLSWTENGTATTWNIEYGAPGFTLGSGTLESGVTSNPFTLSGLTQGSSYEFYVQADCGGGDESSWTGPFEFSLDYCEVSTTYGEYLTSITSNGAVTDISYSASSQPTGSYANETVQTFEAFENQVFDVDTDYSDGSNGVKIWVDWNKDLSFDPVGELMDYDVGTGGTRSLSFAVPGATPVGDYRVRIRGRWSSSADPAPCGSESYGSTVDFTLTVVSPPSCLPVSALNVVSDLPDGAIVNWTENGSATTWNVEYGATGYTQGSGTTVSGVTSTTYTFSGLTAETGYDFYVQADCGGGDESTWAGPFSFTTACSAVLAPWSEDFENGGAIPTCWSQGVSNAKDWEFDDSGSGEHIGNDGTINGNTSSNGYFAWLDDSSPHEIGTSLLSPFVDISALTDPILRFYLLSDNEGETNVDFSVDLWDGAAWNVAVYSSNTNTIGGWEQISVPLNTLTITGDVRIRFVVDENNGTDYYDDIAIDDVELIETPACLAPSVLSASNMTSSSADLAWTENGSATLWNIEYDVAGFTLGSGTPENGVTNPYTLTGLSENTEYEFYVQADCGGTEQSTWVGPFSFTTECAVKVAPWTYTVESAMETTSSEIEDCWSSMPNNTTSDYRWNVEGSGGDTPSSSTGPDAPYDGDSYFYIEASSGSTGDIAYLNSPAVDITALTTPTLRFFYHMYGSNIDNLSVEVSDDNGATWSSELSIAGEQQTSGSDAWVEETVDLSAYSGTIQVRFLATKGSSYYGDIALDRISIFNVQTCLPVSAVSSSNITATQAELAWTENNSSTSWNIEYGPQGFAVGTGVGTPETATTNPHTISGLTANTLYDFYIQSDCGSGDVSEWSLVSSFRTECDVQVAPWMYDVETAMETTSSEITDCWESSPGYTSSDYRWNVEGSGGGTPSSSTGPDAPYSGDSYFYIEATSGSTGDTAHLMSPVIDVTTLTTPLLSFYYHMYGDDVDTLYIEVTDDGGATWIKEDSIIGQQQMSGSEPWAVRFIDLGSYSGNLQVRFSAIKGSSYEGDIAIDDISISEMPSCLMPSSLTASVLSTTDVELGWIENGSATAWNIEYGAPGFTLGSGTPESATSNPYTLTGLTFGSTYEYYVQADCGSGDLSLWAGPFEFTMEYCEVSTTNTSDYLTEVISSGALTDVSYTASSQPAGSYANETAQTFEAYETQTFDINTDYQGGSNAVNIWVDWNNDLNFDASELVGSSNGSITHTISVTVPAGTALGDYRVRVRGQWGSTANPPACGNVTYGSTVDFNLSVVAEPCFDPSALAVSNETTSSADLAWTQMGSATTWNIEYGAAGFTQGSGTTLSGVTANPYSLTGLAPCTGYDFYVQTDCGAGGTSAWVGPFNFTTKAAPATGVDTQVACETFTWIDGNTYTASNNTATYTIVDGGSAACGNDSIVTLDLTINDAATGTDVQEACETFTWIDGNTYTASNNTATHTIAGGAANGCDSIVTLDLTINNAATGLDTQVACETFDWIDGNTYTSDNNTATHTIVGGAANGCDSIVTLDLTINNAATGLDTQVACESFDWIDGNTYTSDNNTATHIIVGGAANGCDSIVTLNLTIETANEAGNNAGEVVCMNEPVDISLLLDSGADAGGDWIDPSGNVITNTMITASATPDDYVYLYVVDAGSCPADTAEITITVDGGCDYLSTTDESMIDISVHPNPATDVVTIVNPSNTADLKVEMLDMNGRVVLVENKALNNASEATVTIAQLERGVYTLRVYNDEGQKTFKIVKQ